MNYEKAEPLFLKAIQISEKTLGPTHQHVINRLLNLANLYESCGRISESIAINDKIKRLKLATCDEEIIGNILVFVYLTKNHTPETSQKPLPHGTTTSTSKKNIQRHVESLRWNWGINCIVIQQPLVFGGARRYVSCWS